MFQLEQNFLYHAALRAIGRRSTSRPLSGYVYLTYRCNLDCTYCYDGVSGSYPQKRIDRELTTEEWVELFRILRRETDALVITGGEPTVRGDLAALLRQARGMGFRVLSLLTNGLNLGRRLEVLDDVDFALVSLDTLDSGRAQRMYGRSGVLEKILENLELAAGLQEEKRFRLYAVVCLTPGNLADALRVVDFALERGIGVTLSPEVRGWTPAAGLLGNPEYEAVVDRLIALKRSGADVLGSFPFYEGVRSFEPFDCEPTLLCRVKPNGDLIYPCNRQSVEGVNLLALGGYEPAIREAIERWGPPATCPHSCHEGCYLDFSALVAKPWRLAQEAWLQALRQPRARRSGAKSVRK